MTKYNLDLLREIIKRDKCKIELSNYTKLNREIAIKFICNCGTEDSKVFRTIFEKGGAFCKKCTKTTAVSILKKSLMEKYGVENPSQIEGHKEKTIKTHLKNRGVEHHTKLKETKKLIKETNLKRYGTEYPTQSLEIKDKTKQTNLKKYGVEYGLLNEEVKDKIKQTNIERYGFENVAFSPEIQEKTKQTNLIKFGVEYAIRSDEIQEKIKQTCLEKYGTGRYMFTDEFTKKSRQTCLEKYGSEQYLSSDHYKQVCLEKYGVEYPMQNAEIFEKASHSRFKPKEFIFPDNSIALVQGYEPIALEMLVNIGYLPEDIITSRKEVPEIWYVDSDNKKHRYFCDIYVRSENLIIEVKSDYTYHIELDINNLKAKSCRDLGYKFEFWIIDQKSNQIEII
jgi:hypothetical protein